MLNSKVHVVVASNKRYLPGLKATFASMIMASSNKDALQFHVVADGLATEDQEDISSFCKKCGYEGEVDFRFIDASYFAQRVVAFKGAYTAYLRLHFPDLFDDLDWILWTDVDVLWFRDPAELWELRDSNVSLLWCHDFRATQRQTCEFFSKLVCGYNPSDYCCSGVMLMNLKRLRERSFVAACNDYLEKFGAPPKHDQDMLNLLCYGDTLQVDDTWDCLDPCPNIREGIVLHFQGVGSLFGRPYSHWHPAYEIWFRFYEQVVEGKAGAEVAPLWKRTLFNALGLWYTPLWLAKILALPFMGKVDACNIHRPLYFCWLRRKIRWNHQHDKPNIPTNVPRK